VPTFDQRAEWFDDHYRTTRGRVRRQLVLERLREAIPPPPASVLDVGGGSGAIAIPLAQLGYRVTLLDPSDGMRDVAKKRAGDADVGLTLLAGAVEALPQIAPGPFDVVCCHAVLLYVDARESALRAMRTVARPGGVLSFLEKNREALAVRPGLRGDYAEALRVLEDPVATGNLGIPNQSSGLAQWFEWLAATGWRVDSWAGIRFFSDLASDDLGEDALAALLDLERAAGRREPYRSVARLAHISATAV
jgi:ubiquinone/menaquinone biosynthesis C-methylase UbiE